MRREGARVRIVDGYNLIGAGGGLGLALAQPDKEERLLRLLAAWRSRRRVREPLLVVFDGEHGRLAAGPRRFSRGGLEIEYSLGEPADALILRRVRQARDPRRVEVVTNDRELARAAAASGARVTGSRDFLAAVGATLDVGAAPEKPERSSEAEVEEWLERFSRPEGDGGASS